MRTPIFEYPFRPRPWIDIAAFLDWMADLHPTFRHMAALPHSVIDNNAQQLLAGATSMHDLRVVAYPIMDPPYDVVLVRSPSSLVSPSTGHVVIEHVSTTGRMDRIERPVEDTLPLFWRFIIEKFGVRPQSPSRGPI